MTPKQEEAIFKKLDELRIELPSWAFANTGTRFGKFIDASAATTIEEKLADAAEVNPRIHRSWFDDPVIYLPETPRLT